MYLNYKKFEVKSNELKFIIVIGFSLNPPSAVKFHLTLKFHQTTLKNSCLASIFHRFVLWKGTADFVSNK